MPQATQPKVGDTATYQFERKVCTRCWCVIGDGGMCTYECTWDGADMEERKNHVIVYTYSRIEKVIGERTL